MRLDGPNRVETPPIERYLATQTTISLNRQNAFAIRICFGDLHYGANNAAVPTTTAKHIARDVATLSRFAL